MSDIPRIDWPAIRDMIRAEAYFETVARSLAVSFDRGETAKERGRRLMESKRTEQLTDDEIRRLNEARRRNGGELF